MSYELIFGEKALDELSKLPKEIQRRIYEKLSAAKYNPVHFFERLEGRADYKLRIGDYRAIADIDNETMLICVTKVGHRKNIYER